MTDYFSPPPPSATKPNWKHEYIGLNRAIEAFQMRWLSEMNTDVPDGNGNIVTLLEYHLAMSREMLWATIFNNDDADYQEDADRLVRMIEPPTPPGRDWRYAFRVVGAAAATVAFLGACVVAGAALLP